MKEMWHVSLPAARASIARHGLDNRLAQDEHAVWSNTDDWDDGVYLWESHDMAIAYAWDLADMGHEPDIYQVDASDLGMLPDVTGETPVAGAWWVGHVDPERLALVEQTCAPSADDEPQIGPPMTPRELCC